MSKVLLIFSKTGKTRFIGHLDLIKTFQRAVKRANLPVAYSEGFNPHQKLGFALPLALGMEGYNEAAELELNCIVDVGDIIEKLNNVLPKGILIHEARLMGSDEKSTAALVSAAYYEMHTQDTNGLADKAQRLIGLGSIVIPKKTKKGIKDTDIRPDILTLEVSGNSLKAVLTAGGQRSLKPELLAGAMNVSFYRYARLNIYKTINGTILPLFGQNGGTNDFQIIGG